MEMVGSIEEALGVFERDLENLAANEVLKKTREMKLQVAATAVAVRRSVGGEKWLVVLALVATKGVRCVLHRLHEDKQHQDKRLNDCTFILEDAVMTSYHILRSNSSAGGVTASSAASLSTSESNGVDPTLLRGAYTRVLAFFSDGSSTGQPASAAWADVGLLLSLCWLRRDLQACHHEAIELLDTVVTTTQRSAAAAWPLFIMGLVYAVLRRDTGKALACVKEAVALGAQESLGDSTGVVHYWYAVLLSQNASDSTDNTMAIEQLRVAVRCNYHVVASLNLQALLALQAGDLYAASEALERSIDVDFDQAASMFNYALLLKRMGNNHAQYQMLEYYNEATVAVGDTQDLSKQEAHETVAVFPDDDVSRLFASRQTAVKAGAVALEMANAAVACGAWSEARERFEEYFTSIQDCPVPEERHEHAMRSFIYVLLQCNRPTEALAQCEKAARNVSTRDVIVEFYKADALLCLERVDECEVHLRTVIEPLITKKREEAESNDQDELAQLHIQLRNNLAVAAVCRGDSEQAVVILRDCSKLYPSDQRVVFNLVLLLWRLERRDAACALWFDARGWSLRMDVSDMREQQKALDFVSRAEDEALSSASPRQRITSHVGDGAENSGQVDDQQLRYLDVLVLNHWSKAQNSEVAKTAARYVEYLQSVSDRVSSSSGN